MPLVDKLKGSFEIIALSRSTRTSATGVEWRACDLLSSRDATAAVRGADLAIYLVHSMLPSDHLVQGEFEDFDLLAADNFARACAAHGVQQIVYLGGLLPIGVTRDLLSRHLRSRAEVESALAAKGIPVTTLRAGLILGAGGSSTEIMLRMAKRLPVMICPRWTNTPTQPIALDDVLELIPWVLGRRETFDRTFDIGGPDVLTYRVLMLMAGGLLGREPRTISVPLITPRLSRLWISLVTGAPKALAAPLVESLSHTMVTSERTLHEMAAIPGRPLEETLANALNRDSGGSPRAFHGAARSGPPIVRSVQRITGTRLSPRQAAAEYLTWLASRLAPAIHVSGDAAADWSIHLASPTGQLMLRFRLDTSASSDDRVVYDITGGALAASGSTGRFEFRSILDPGTLVCSVHAFSPRLWWPLYVVTQARLHLLVMHAFARHLGRSFPLQTTNEAPPANAQRGGKSGATGRR